MSDELRLQAIQQYGFREMPHDPALDDIAHLAAELCKAPLAAVGIVEQDEISLLGRFGLEDVTVPRQLLPVDRMLETEGVLQSAADPDFTLRKASLCTLHGVEYLSYAGAPIRTPGGIAIGGVFVLNTEARLLTASQVESMEALSHMVTTRLELIVRVRETQRASKARQRMEAALLVEKNFVAAVLDTVGALVIVFDTTGRIVRFNRACEIISGYRSSDLVNKFAWEHLIPEEDVARYIDDFNTVLHGNFPTAFENRWLSKDGSRRRIAWSATALLDSQGQVAFIIATGIDVTVQRVQETAIRESEARYRQIVEGSLGVVCTHDLEGQILSINQHGAESFGRGVHDVIGHNLRDFLFPERFHLLPPYFEALATTGEAQGLMHLRHTDGDERVLAYRNRLVEPAAGERYVLAFAVDITDQVRAEDQLRVLVRQSNSVLESVGDGIYGIDREGRITVVNPAAAKMLGYEPEDLLGQNMHALVHHSHPDGSPYPEEDCPIRATLRNHSTIRIATEVFWRKDGTPIPVEYVARPQIEVPEETGAELEAAGVAHAKGVVVAFTDISERNALDRMKDEFISTVSHELRTPLTGLRAALGLLSGGALESRPEKAQQMMEIAIGSTDRLVRLVNDILDLERIGSGKADMHFASCSMEEIFRRSIGLLGAQAARANIDFEVEAQAVSVWADPDRILQTVTNLLSNAIKFSPEEDTAPTRIYLRAAYVSRDEALMEVEDQGRGIPEDKLDLIFERFQQIDASDARTMGGTGLGLAICRSILAQHGGRIWATSEVGQGSTFYFTLPTQPRRRLR